AGRANRHDLAKGDRDIDYRTGPIIPICGGGRHPNYSGAASRIPLRIDAHAAAVLVLATPGDDEVTGSIHRHVGVILIVSGVGVDLELGALGHAGSVIPLRIVAGAVAVLVLPGNDEVADGIHRHVAVILSLIASRVDLEL